MSSIAPTLILLGLISILSPAYSFKIGDNCPTNISPIGGICRPFANCPTVSRTLLPNRDICGQHSKNLICCPKMSVSRNRSIFVTKAGQRLRYNTRIIGSLAKAKCAENAEILESLKILRNVARPQCPIEISRLVDVEIAKPKEFPHMAILGFGNDSNIVWRCGGSLISDRIVLTAAHCVYSMTYRIKLVKIGVTYRYENAESTTQIIKIDEILIHPLYRIESNYYDIAILRLENKVNYNERVRPACLPVDLPDINENNMHFSILWESEYRDEDYTRNYLYKAQSYLKNCDTDFFEEIQDWHLNDVMNDSLICTEESFRSNEGLLTAFNKKHECMFDVIGINVKNDDCIFSNVYTRVSHYIRWIEEMAWPEFFH